MTVHMGILVIAYNIKQTIKPSQNHEKNSSPNNINNIQVSAVVDAALAFASKNIIHLVRIK